jgi:hypothetical protein
MSRKIHGNLISAPIHSIFYYKYISIIQNIEINKYTCSKSDRKSDDEGYLIVVYFHNEPHHD